MKKSSIIFMLLLLGSGLLFAQTTAEGVKKHQLKVNLLVLPNIDYELGVSSNSTLHFQIGTQVGGVEEVGTNDLYIGLFPAARVSYRKYYNFKRRIEKGRNTNNNSANYFGLASAYVNSNAIIIEKNLEIIGDYLQIGAVYGFQRTYFNRLNFGVEGGVGYGYSEPMGGRVVPILTFNLGWVFI